jgi:Zn-dependent protease with chaperone function
MNLDKKTELIDFSFKNYIEQQKKSSFIRFDSNNISDYSFIGDRQGLEILTKFEKIKIALESMVRIERDKVKAELLGGGVRVTSEQFPRIYNSLVYCSKKLGIPIPETFVHQNVELNAFTIGTNDDSVIVLNNGLVDQLSEEELRYVIGHECGHIQNGHVTYMYMAYLMARVGYYFLWILIFPFLMALKHWSRQAEITADRAGLICCQDLQQAKQVMVKAALGSKELFNQVNMEEYMSQLEDLKPNIGRLNEFFKTHPYLPKRVAALELYEQTENYISKKDGVFGEGSDLHEVDKKVVEILKIL